MKGKVRVIPLSCSKCGKVGVGTNGPDGWLCRTCANTVPETVPVPSPMIDPEVMAEYRRSVEQFEGRKEVPR